MSQVRLALLAVIRGVVAFEDKVDAVEFSIIFDRVITLVIYLVNLTHRYIHCLVADMKSSTWIGYQWHMNLVNVVTRHAVRMRENCAAGR